MFCSRTVFAYPLRVMLADDRTGLVAGRHCLPGHEERLRALGVRHIARDFEEVATFLA